MTHVNPTRCNEATGSDTMATANWTPEITGNIFQGCIIMISDNLFSA